MKKLCVKRRNNKSEKGFTLAETLVAVLILLLVSSVVAAGIPAAIRAYDKVVTASNAEVLLSTTMSALRNELSTAKMIDTDSYSDQAVSYFSEGAGFISKIDKKQSSESGTEEDPAGTIMYQRYASNAVLEDAKIPENAERIRLVSKAASNKNLHTTYDSVNYDKDKGIVVFTDLRVSKDSGSDTNVSRDTFSVRVLGAVDEEAGS